MCIFILFVLISSSSCNRDHSNSKGRVSSGSISSKETAQEFSRGIHATIPLNLKLETNEVNELLKEGLISNEEASLLISNL